MKTTRKIVEINEDLCNGCGECVPACAEGALKIINGKARLVSEIYCDGLGACLGGCPQGAIRIIEREAEEFDEKAVHEYLKKEKEVEKEKEPLMACGCPSTRMQIFNSSPCSEANSPVAQTSSTSALTHWPVQIRLVPTTAPFLRGADLLIAADCTAFAYAAFHNDLLKGRAVMVGCPKLDNAEEYFHKFIDIFTNTDIKSVTVVSMEVPCCSKLPMIVRKALEIAGKNIPLKEVVISTRGQIINRKSAAA